MNDPAILQRLIWKDVETIKPLVWTALALSVAANLLLFFICRIDGNTDPALVGWSIAFWIVVPNLVALGAPAYLVGSEEESGTIRWLRSLPIRWQQVADVKLLVAFGAAAITWVFTSLVLWLASFGWPTGRAVSVDQDLVSPPGVLVILLCSMMLLLLGFCTSYLIRSPLLALIALIPTFFFTLICVINFVYDFGLMRGGNLVWLFPFIAVVLTSLWCLQRILAWWRLQSRDQTLVSKAAALLSPAGRYRPRSMSFGSKPSQVRSLLWQQARQTGPLCLALLVVSALLALMASGTVRNPNSPPLILVLSGVAPLFIALSASCFGVMVFYRDNVHRRCSFFADRGVSPTRVWWTRMVPPASACLLLIVLIGLIMIGSGTLGVDHLRRSFASYIVSMVVLFAYGQLVSQWTSKPLLAFAAAPAYAFVSMVPISYLIGRWHGTLEDGLFSMMLMVPVLLLATWRLTGRWLEGRINRGYTARVIGYTALAVLLPCLWLAAPHLQEATVMLIGYATGGGVMP